MTAMTMADLDKLRGFRDELAGMCEDPLHGFGCPSPDRGLDLNDGTADLVIELVGESYKITIERLS
jgi:hypothetical protein